MSWLFFLDESGHDHKQTPYRDGNVYAEYGIVFIANPYTA
jgi:hypothetical protein